MILCDKPVATHAPRRLRPFFHIHFAVFALMSNQCQKLMWHDVVFDFCFRFALILKF